MTKDIYIKNAINYWLRQLNENQYWHEEERYSKEFIKGQIKYFKNFNKQKDESKKRIK